MTAMPAGQGRPYFDQRINCESVFVMPGQHYVQKAGVGAISTLLGSCVSACIRSRSGETGGLNHFLLPDAGGEDALNRSARYGVNAMELLINDLMKLGVQRQDLVAKVFGGANVISVTGRPVGAENGHFVKEFLRSENIPLLAEDLGGNRARRIYFFPATGRVSVLLVAPTAAPDIAKKENQIRETALADQKSGAVELF